MNFSQKQLFFKGDSLKKLFSHKNHYFLGVSVKNSEKFQGSLGLAKDNAKAQVGEVGINAKAQRGPFKARYERKK